MCEAETKKPFLLHPVEGTSLRWRMHEKRLFFIGFDPDDAECSPFFGLMVAGCLSGLVTIGVLLSDASFYLLTRVS